MLDGLAPDLAPRLLIAIGGVAVAFLVLIAVLLFLRRRNAPLFIKGGRAREHRLLVLDAAAVDAKRRLVLIRRDDTEHLIMIGGPTDIVIETGISGASRPKAVTPAPGAVKPAVAGQQPVQAVAQRPAAADKPVVAAPIPPRPAEVAIPAASNHGQADNGRRQRQGQNGEQGQNQRRLERQAARAAEAAKAAGPQLGTVSAAGAVLYGADREPPAGEKKMPAMPADNAARESGERLNIVASDAENVLDVARGRVLNQQAQRDESPNEGAIRALEKQLDAGKAEAAKAEAARTESARLEAERAAAAKADAERAEAVRAEASRLETARLEAQKAEAARLEAERAERMRLEAERAEAERAEASRIEAEKAENARAEAARVEAERVAAARAEAMARFEAARRAQAEQRQAAQQASVQRPAEQQPGVQQEQRPADEAQTTAQPVVQRSNWPIVEPPVAEPAEAKRQEEAASLEDAGSRSQERLASDFERLLEAELEADGILDNYPAPTVAGERREPGSGAPTVNPVQRDVQPITGAVPGVSIEQDMARRLGEISLNKKTDSL